MTKAEAACPFCGDNSGYMVVDRKVELHQSRDWATGETFETEVIRTQRANTVGACITCGKRFKLAKHVPEEALKGP